MSVVDAISTRAARIAIERAAGALRYGELTARFPEGRTRVFGIRGASPGADIEIRDNEFFRRVLLHGEIGFGEAYVDGLWRTSDLAGLLEFGIAARKHVNLTPRWLGAASRLRNVRLHRGRRNTVNQARHNIHAHYDLGNEFFRLFLDKTMTYSCAYFATPEEPLEDAQRRKYRRLSEKAHIGSNDHVLEIGSGWGGFAMFAASEYGCRVTTITLSEEQLALARERIDSAGLSPLVDVRFCDYRDIGGEFDKIVSIEMFEAVGAEYFATFFQACDRLLKPGGRFAMQTITVPDRSFSAMRDGVNWIQKYIFPGGMLPSIAEIERALRDTSLVIDGVEDIAPHYAMTLRRWRERFMSRLPEVRALGFDDRFIRMWEYYLAGSEAGFRTRNTGDIQIVFDKPAVTTAARVVEPSRETAPTSA